MRKQKRIARKKHPRPVILVCALVVIVCAQLLYQLVPEEQVLGAQINLATEQLLLHTNAARADHDVPTLIHSDRLARAAEMKASDMFAQQYWDHNAPDGTLPWKWLAVVDYSYSEAGENLARGFDNSAAIIEAWLESPSHRENLLNIAYAEVGFASVAGTLEGKSTTLVVALYAKPAVSPVLVGALSPDASESDFWLDFERTVKTLVPALVFAVTILTGAAAVAYLAKTIRKYPSTRRGSC